MPLRITEQWNLRDEDRTLDLYRMRLASNERIQLFLFGSPQDPPLTDAWRQDRSPEGGIFGRPGQQRHIRKSQGELDRLNRDSPGGRMQVAYYDDRRRRDRKKPQFRRIGKKSLRRTIRHRVSHRIVHCQVGANDIYRRMAELGVMAIDKPSFGHRNWPTSNVEASERREPDGAMAWKTLLHYG
jgi:hypothetical protein